MPIIEKLGAFYLGKRYDLAQSRLLDETIIYDARDLTTHAVCVGMTGSGKTGLCIDLLEEAALDNVPAILIDPKGDITNLLLTFPDLRPEDFQPWINLDDARRKGLSEDEYARSVAETWSKGLADWDQGPERLRALKNAADFRIYTPGSDAGIPVSILSSFRCPALSWDDDEEALRDQIQGTVGALLGLVGIDADPLRSREHILLSNIIETAWRKGEDLDLAKLITAIQNPPVRQLGVFDVDTFFPEKDRFGLAMSLNSIIAAPSFATWIRGEALDAANFLHAPNGKPRHSIFYIAHLSDAERMFFVTLLLEAVIAWMRKQPGTTSLRALLYMDEIFGYFPPTANPPSKKPMLTLLKQARAFGLGVMLTTQNPVDLDYKGLTNTGTWFIGKLQTERDKARVLDGLESAAPGAGLDRSQIDRTISGLGNRVFLLHNVNQQGPVIFNTRWAMSYLRGPLTRSQVRTLMAPVKAEAAAPKAAAGTTPSGSPRQVSMTDAAPASETSPLTASGYSRVPPTLPPDLRQVFLPVRISPNRALAALETKTGDNLQAEETTLVYTPLLLALGAVTFADRARGVNQTRAVGRLVKPGDLGAIVRWEAADAIDLNERDFEPQAEGEALFASVPDALNSAAEIKTYQRDFIDFLYRQQQLELFYSPSLKLYGQADESERDFKARAQMAAREQRDAEVEALHKKYKTQLERLQTRLEREKTELSENKAELAGRGREEWLSGAETVVGMLGLFGRRRSSGLSRAATKRRLTANAKADVAESEAEIARLEEETSQIESDRDAEIEEIGRKWAEASENFETYVIRPKKTDCQANLVALAWAPTWEIGYRTARGALTHDRIPAWDKPKNA
ncbi:MAG: hypothetical protein K1X65_20415 [Caldilineales bacterium]|nr:hypothetical protein [Caldilineales bacterium]